MIIISSAVLLSNPAIYEKKILRKNQYYCKTNIQVVKVLNIFRQSVYWF